MCSSDLYISALTILNIDYYNRISTTDSRLIRRMVTFDRNIRSREYDLSLSAGDYGECLLEKGQCLMEIKGGGGMPVGLARILSDMQIYPVSFSKYGNVYKNMLRSEAAELRAQ